MGRALRRLYRHVGLNLYDQPLSRGRISSAIGALFLQSCSRNVCRRRNFVSTLYGKAAHVIHASRRSENKRGEEADRDCATPDTKRTRAEDVTFDIILGCNPDGTATIGICQLAHTCQSFSAKQKLYMTSARLEKDRNTCKARHDTGRYPTSRVHFCTSRIIRNDVTGDRP